MNRRHFFVLSSSGLITLIGGHALLAKKEQDLIPSDIQANERADTLAAMKPPKRARPVIAVIADNRGSETTDFIIPWSVLTRSGVADVFSVATNTGPVQLMLALKVLPDRTIDQFNDEYPDGADYVVVPAFHNPKAKKAIEWLQQQRKTGATIMGVCAGALPIAHAGLLDGKRATTHWYHIKEIQRISPSMIRQADRRYVADNGVITTTGVSASLPASLALVEAIAGKEVSNALATKLGMRSYDQFHVSDRYKLQMENAYRIAMNALALTDHQKLGVRIDEDMDELSLAFSADAWSRTFKSKCFTISDQAYVRSLNGLNIIPDLNKAEAKKIHFLPTVSALPGEALDVALNQIADRFGYSTAKLVALQLEYPWSENREHL